ncbi:hypothetical protein Nepgr_015172 [Nepenthes gracilis]|uniref:Uncharacterized protein n=1 Tax=Nepenthes gracilis TaxID=150966 RepID=A0AAD3SN56_NEPGR|nr:hypothetical protein Nepgr_015172 [Nepenthes gracilis]
MARINYNQQLATLRSENENVRNLNDRLIQDLVEKNREIANLLESKKSLTSELARSYRDKAELVAELEAMRLASKGSTVKMAEMKLQLEALHRSVAQAHKKSFWTLALSGTAIIAAVASFAHFSARGNA